MAACGPGAWPPDFNNDGFVDITDLQQVTTYNGQAVPPAPVRYDLGPEPAGDNFIGQLDIDRVNYFFGQHC